MKPKQLPLTGVPKAERAPLVLTGDRSVEFELDLLAPWPMPPSRPWEPLPQKPLLAVWERVRGMVR
jgi:hypothetical protein